MEDDETIAGGLKNHLGKWNYQAECMTDFKDVMGKFVDFEPQLVLLDIVLPFFNGFHWCQEIRKISKVPIIFLSSANDNMNIVMAMNMGADDFINKPFDLNVITAKIQAMIRRTYSFSKQFHILTYKELILNLLEATVSYHDQVIELTKNELKIMQMLFEKAETYVSRDELMIELWQSDQFVDDNTLSVNMNRLRKKLDDFGLDSLIQTKKGIGYKLAYDETASLL